MCAKSKGFFGMRRGSTKSLTFQVVDGQQITKDRVSEVRNPKTQGQQVQRAIMATVTQAYSHMKAICDHSFEGESYGAHNQRKFVSENLRLIRQRLAAAGAAYQTMKAFTPLGSNVLAIQPYLVSSGSLSPAKQFSGTSLSLGSVNTYAAVASQLQVEQGDQITFLVIGCNEDTRDCTFAFERIVMQPVSAQGEDLPMSTPFLDESGLINMPNPKNTFGDAFDIQILEGGALMLNPIIELPTYGLAVVRSAYVDGAWKRSRTVIAVEEDAYGYTLAEAIASAASHIDVDNPYYLNQADEVPSEV